MAETTIKWSNFLRPTPSNILYLVEGIKGIILTVSGTLYIMDNAKIAFCLMFAGAVLDFVAKFISRVEKESHEVVTVEYPSSVADQVTVKTETKE